MIQHLGHLGKTELLKICNLSWTQGILPEEWREAEIIPIYKQVKPKNDKTSYRLISLLSFICKTMERMVNTRLLQHLEQNGILSDSQSGYRKFRSIEDQTTYLAQEVEDAFQKKTESPCYFFLTYPKHLTKFGKKDFSANFPNVALKERC